MTVTAVAMAISVAVTIAVSVPIDRPAVNVTGPIIGSRIRHNWRRAVGNRRAIDHCRSTWRRSVSYGRRHDEAWQW
jgi:hypothetical protein